MEICIDVMGTLEASSFRSNPSYCILCVCTNACQNGEISRSCLLLGPPGSNWCFSFAPELVGYSAPRDLHRRAAYSICESWFLIHQDVYHDLFVCS